MRQHSKTKKQQPESGNAAEAGSDSARSGGVYRTDLLAHAMNPGKERSVLALLRAWRSCAVLVAAEQWRRFFEEGAPFWENYRSPRESELARVAGAANRVQMVRRQVVGTLRSFLGNRKSDFTRRVMRMALAPERRPWFTEELRHELLFVNSWSAWFSREPLRMTDGREVSPLARELARRMMRDILAHHRRPDLSHANMVLNSRVASFTEAIDPAAFWAAEKAAWEERQKEARERREAKRKASGIANDVASGVAAMKRSTRKTRVAAWKRKSAKREAPRPEREKRTVFPYWLKLPTMRAGETIMVPLLAHERFAAREGELRPTVQVNLREGRLFFGLVTDTARSCELSREAYEPLTEELSLDFGLRTLFSTDRGDLLGRNFLAKLSVYDRRISRLASYRQQHGLRVRSRRYDREVRKLRGFLRSEVGRVLNRMVEVHRPGRIVVERLHFRSSHLSKRMNRLVSNCGRRIIQEKLEDLHERFGIEVVEVNPAYSSQTCSACEYVDRRNRSGERFKCLWCGHTLHADVNAARNLRARRSRSTGRPVLWTKAQVLRAQVESFLERCAERKEGREGTSRDPRVVNPYFADWRSEVISSGQLSAA